MPKKPKSPRSRISAGLLMFRRRNNELEVLLAHPGGPFHVHKDDGAWTIPKGEAAPGEDVLTRAQIEFEEEVGFRPKNVRDYIELGSIYKRAARLCTPGHSRAICRKHSNANQIYSKWNGPLVLADARNFPRWIRRAFFLTKSRDAKSSRHRYLFWTVYAPRSRLISPTGTDPLWFQETIL